MQFFNRASDFIEKYRFLKFFITLFLFMQPFKESGSLREAAFAVIVILLLIRFAGRAFNLALHDRTLQSLGILVLIAVLSSALSYYRVESFDAMRKNLLYQVVIFLAIVNEYRDMVELKSLFYAMFLSFFTLSALIVLKYDTHVLFNWLEHSDDTWLRGYSLFATFYMPIILGYIYSLRKGARVKAMLFAFWALGLALTVLNNHRTQLVAVVLSAAVVTLMARRYRTFAAGAVIFAVSALLFTHFKPAPVERYKTLFSTRTYVTDEYTGLNDRAAIWKGTLDMVKRRPILGYGYGWKKIALAARDYGFLEKWDRDGRTYAYFDQFGYGRANPHNLALQILFETGVIGLAAFTVFWATVIIKAASVSREQDNEGARFLHFGIIGLIVSYLIINLTNGLWEESYGIIMMAAAAITVVLFKADRTFIR